MEQIPLKVRDMPKLESPFIRKMIDGNYIVTPEINEELSWVFENPDVIATEKLHGTNVSILIETGQITAIFNRTARVPIFNKGKRFIIDALLESWERGYMDMFADGQYFGEVIGPKLNGNPYKLDKHIWVPFATYAKEHLRYKSWGKYPKDFQTISNWFKDDLLPLFALKRGDKQGFVEGIVFVHPDGRMAKLRKDMFDWYTGHRHKEGEQNDIGKEI